MQLHFLSTLRRLSETRKVHSFRTQQVRQLTNALQRKLAQQLFPSILPCPLVRKFTIEPKIPVFVKVPVKSTPVVLTKLRVQTGFHWVKTQQAGRKTVEGTNLAPFQMTQGIRSTLIHLFFPQVVTVNKILNFALHIHLG